MINEMQHWLGSNRPPRVQITYDVETLGSTVQAQIPFVVGIIGDFAGGDRPASNMADRAFIDIDRDNFKTVMQGLAPSLQLTATTEFEPKYEYVPVRTPEGPGVQAGTVQFAPALTFNSVDDFAPPSIIRQVPDLQALMTTRQNLSDLAAKLGTSPSLEAVYLARAT
ncbi:MAG TPA: type VI secretion system contractile sheath small subunit, partial [Longimicrobium sp.]|nr:type VI secretion system contractile sheath small subunit [Longimicrobium sp.]